MNEGSMKITSTQLRQMGACEDQVNLFEELFGSEVELTLDICLQNAHQFNFDWAAEKMLTAPAYAEYQRVRAAAYAEYVRVRAPALAEYERAKAAAYAEYRRANAPAYAEYDRVRAAAFYQGLLSSKKGG